MLSRRQAVQVAASTALAHSVVTVLGCQAGSPPAKDPAAKAPKAETEPKPLAASPVSPELARLAALAADCARNGETCLEHCLRSLAGGSTMMGDCARAVQPMIQLCAALSRLSAMGSKHVKELAKICASACADCALACRPHVDHHAECKACFESCQACEAACRALA